MTTLTLGQAARLTGLGKDHARPRSRGAALTSSGSRPIVHECPADAHRRDCIWTRRAAIG